MASNPEVLVFTLRGTLDASGPFLPYDAYAREVSHLSETDIRSMLGSSVTVRCELEFPGDGSSLRGTVLLRISEHGISEAAYRALADTIVLAVKGAFTKARLSGPPNVQLSDLQAVQTNGGPKPKEAQRLRPPSTERRGIGLVVTLLLGMFVSDVHWLIARDAQRDPSPALAAASNADAQAAGSANQELEELQARYARSIEQAAVRKPGMRVPLMPIVDDPVQVVTFSSRSPVDAQNRIVNYVWVSQPAELIAFCRRSLDPLLTVQQALGLPPYRSANEMQNSKAYVLLVRKADLFRPCVSGTDVSAPACELSPPEAQLGQQTDNDDRRFVNTQLWGAHKNGFTEIGYPFTGMGWTYNWNPSSRDHVGVSEYVVRPRAKVEVKPPMTAGEFCAGNF
ncbi:hypothetical protein BG58_40930 [Caballeronia jiangsuensis]|nr:hypothetical protein BG58_40930 [Caballeronia jiangsuensis]